MRKTIRFSKFFLPAVLISSVLIAIGLIGYAFKGFNLGVDFQAGINQTLQLAFPVAEVSYTGKGNADLTVSDTAVTLVLSGAEVEKKTILFDYKTYPTIADIATALQAQADVHVKIEQGQESTQASLLVPSFQGNTLLNTNAVMLHRVPASAEENFSSIEKVRNALVKLGNVSVQTIKPASQQRYLIRVQDKGKDAKFTETVRAEIKSGLETAFGPNRVIEIQTDLVGAQFSAALAKQASLMVLATLAGILAYCAIRFKIEYAIGAVLSVFHDALIMIAFIVWTRMEFNTSTIAAILTILGYSINDTIVQYDRVREERRLRPNEKFTDVLDIALSLTLSRTLITTLTTLLTVIALFIFTKGSMRDFALALIVGMTSGVYSTIYVAGAFVDWWDKIRTKRAKKGDSAPKLSDKPAEVVAEESPKA
jgi:preprotein translocase subunit SecF